MRLDHLLSKEEMTFFAWIDPTKTEEMTFFVWIDPTKTEEMTFFVWSNPTKTEEEVESCCLLFRDQGEEKSRGQGIKGEHVHLTRLKKTSPSAVNNLSSRLENTSPRT